jgi:hypothetical protein
MSVARTPAAAAADCGLSSSTHDHPPEIKSHYLPPRLRGSAEPAPSAAPRPPLDDLCLRPRRVSAGLPHGHLDLATIFFAFCPTRNEQGRNAMKTCCFFKPLFYTKKQGKKVKKDCKKLRNSEKKYFYFYCFSTNQKPGSIFPPNIQIYGNKLKVRPI